MTSQEQLSGTYPASGSEQRFPLNRNYLFVLAVFSAIAFAVKWLELDVTVPGINVALDPREIFIIIGAALTGPVGGAIIGFFSGLYQFSLDVSNMGMLATLITHVAAGAFAGAVYKFVIHRYLKNRIAQILAWVAMIFAYYFLVLLPVVLIVLYASSSVEALFGEYLPFFTAYEILFSAGLNEFLITAAVTTVVFMLAMPAQYRRPLPVFSRKDNRQAQEG